MLSALVSQAKVVGVKQSARAIREGRASRLFLACDADTMVTDRVRQVCGALPVVEDYTWPSWDTPAASRLARPLWPF